MEALGAAAALRRRALTPRLLLLGLLLLDVAVTFVGRLAPTGDEL